MRHTVFVIMGRPGSGKSVQAKLLAEKSGFRRFSPGDRYREIAAEDTSIGRKVKEIIGAGKLGPHWLSIYLFQDALFSLSDAEGIVFEGIGRKKEEAERFHETMQWLGRDYVVLYLEVSASEVTKRLNLRREKESRSDDDEEDIPVRLDEYERHTAPAIAFFESVGTVIRINGEQSIEDVHAEICRSGAL